MARDSDEIKDLTVGQLKAALVGALQKAGIGSNNQQQ